MPNFERNITKTLDCIVIGAGPAGLAAGRFLLSSGATFKIVESEDGPGGRTRSTQYRGFIIDKGAAFLTSFYRRTLSLANTLELPLIRIGFHPGRRSRLQSLVFSGQLLPHNIGTAVGLLRFPYVPLLQKLRTVIAACSSAFTPSLHIANLSGLARADSEDARTWAERRIGTEAYNFFVRVAFEPFFFYDSAEVSAAFVRALLGHSVAWRLFTPTQGMGALCTAFSNDLPVEFGTRVSAIERTPTGFLVKHSLGNDHARTVVVATPRPLQIVDALIDKQDCALLSGVRFVPSVRLNLYYSRQPFLTPPAITPVGPGSRGLVGISSMSAWRPMSGPQREDIVRLSASAWRSEQLMGLSPAQIAKELLTDCASLGVYLPAPDDVGILAEPEAIVQTPPGHFRRACEFLRRDRKGLVFAGDWLTGSTIEGAVRSGEAAAKIALNAFRANDAPAARVPEGMGSAS